MSSSRTGRPLRRRGDPFTLTLAEAFAATFRDLGGTATTVHCKPCDETDADAALAAAASVDVLFLPLFRPEADVVLARYRDVPGLADAAIVGGDGMSDAELLASPASVGIYVVMAHGYPLGGGEPVRLPAGEEVKIAFRVTGRGEPSIDAVGPGGVVLAPADGPDRHQGSSWHRPGEESAPAGCSPSRAAGRSASSATGAWRRSS